MVIATLGRPTVVDAVASALAQNYAAEAVVVVIDGPRESVQASRILEDRRVEIIALGSRHGLPFARNAGIGRLATDLIALLDDDDEWLPAKLQLQIERFLQMRDAGTVHPVIGCRAIIQDVTRKVITIAPERLIHSRQSVSDYLFRRRRIRPREAILGASMLVFDRALAQIVVFDSDLTRHDDWDWLLRVGARTDVAFAHVPEVGIRYTVQASANSARRGWKDSVAWPFAHGAFMTPREQGDFLLCVSAPIAVAYWDWRGLATIVGKVVHLRAASLRSWLFLLGLILLSFIRAGRRRLS
ncbi:MAG: glycosyltransferase [Candidatus Dormiibacterota bacterium]